MNNLSEACQAVKKLDPKYVWKFGDADDIKSKHLLDQLEQIFQLIDKLSKIEICCTTCNGSGLLMYHDYMRKVDYEDFCDRCIGIGDWNIDLNKGIEKCFEIFKYHLNDRNSMDIIYNALNSILEEYEND